jgi:hypothetical protein
MQNAKSWSSLPNIITTQYATHHAICCTSCNILYMMQYAIRHAICYTSCNMPYIMHYAIHHAIRYALCMTPNAIVECALHRDADQQPTAVITHQATVIVDITITTTLVRAAEQLLSLSTAYSGIHSALFIILMPPASTCCGGTSCQAIALPCWQRSYSSTALCCTSRISFDDGNSLAPIV